MLTLVIVRLMYSKAWNMQKYGSKETDKIQRYLRIAYAISVIHKNRRMIGYILEFCKKNYPDKDILSGLGKL